MEFLEVRSYVDNDKFDELYVVDARFQMKTNMTYELLRDNPEIRQKCIERMKQSIVEELFGEFRPHLHNLRFAIYKNDQREALDILNKLTEQMYG